MELDTNKITADVITELAKSSAKALYNKASEYLTDLSGRVEIDFGLAYKKYIERVKNTFEKSKTILYGREPRNLYSFYECMNLEYGDKIISSHNVNNLLELGHNIVVTGTGGIGKSILMKHLCINTIVNQERVPIFFELRELNNYDEKDIDIEKIIYEKLQIFGFEFEERFYQYSLEEGRYIILLDGYDEVKNQLAMKVSKEILEFSRRYPENYYIISSRPLTEFRGWSDYIELNTVPLDKEQALSLINKLDYDEVVKEKFSQALEEELYDKYESFASNPLLLTIMLMTFEDRLSIPDNLNDFFDQAFATLFFKHDSYKGAYQREILSKLSYEDFRKVFSYFCFWSFFNNEFMFSDIQIFNNLERAEEKVGIFFDKQDYLKDMTNAVCMLVQEGLNYRFSHRAFQEYFSAVYATQLSDRKQKIFITEWLKKESMRMSTSFLKMLYELQRERFIENILLPGLLEIKRLYESSGDDLNYVLLRMFNSIDIFKTPDEEMYKAYVSIRNSYLDLIMDFTLEIGNFNYESRKKHWEIERSKVASLILEKYGDNHEQTFKTLDKDGYLDEVLKNFDWIKDRIKFCLDYLESLQGDKLTRKRKFENLLEEF